MTKNDVKGFLEEYWYDNQYLNEKMNELEKIKSQKQKLGNLDTFNATISLAEQQENDRLQKIINKKQRIEDFISSVPQPYRTVLYFKYICFLSFDQIADRMHYSTKRIYQLHGEALDKLVSINNSQNQNISTN